MDEEVRERHRATMRRYMHRRRAADPEGARQRLQDWRDRNREKVRAYDRERRAGDPIGTAASGSAVNANQRAKRFGATGHLRKADILALWERQPTCVGCGKGRGVDHVIDMSAGGENVPANLQNLCFGCNSAKESARKKAAPTCANGHERSADNLYVVPGNGQRACRACAYARNVVQRRKAGIPERRAVHGATWVPATTEMTTSE